MTTINVKKINDKAILPTYGSEYAAGADLYACLDEPLTIKPHETVMVHTGLAMEIPAGYAGLIYPRSGLASKRGLAPANKVGVVDPDYRGEFMIERFVIRVFGTGGCFCFQDEITECGGLCQCQYPAKSQ